MLKIIIYLIITSTIIFAHGGRTDSNGGHNNRSTGEYHYHNGGHSTNSYTSSGKYVLSTFKDKEFKGLGDTFNTKSECMKERYKLWTKNRNAGWTYGCRKS